MILAHASQRNEEMAATFTTFFALLALLAALACSLFCTNIVERPKRPEAPVSPKAPGLRPRRASSVELGAAGVLLRKGGSSPLFMPLSASFGRSNSATSQPLTAVASSLYSSGSFSERSAFRRMVTAPAAFPSTRSSNDRELSPGLDASLAFMGSWNGRHEQSLQAVHGGVPTTFWPREDPPPQQMQPVDKNELARRLSRLQERSPSPESTPSL